MRSIASFKRNLKAFRSVSLVTKSAKLMIDCKIRHCSYCRNALKVNFVTVGLNERIFTKRLKWLVLGTRNSRLKIIPAFFDVDYCACNEINCYG